MNIYFSGISGTGIGPLAEMALDAGFKVFGSDKKSGSITKQLQDKGIEISIGEQDGAFLRNKFENDGIDWLVYTSALPADHPELIVANELGIKTSKRDDFINFILKEKNLKLVAIAGTHGKTTTAAMIIWACHKLNIPLSYLVGSTLPWAASGKYNPESQFFVYEADEYDKNFLKFEPWLSVITTETYDHPDIYNTEEDYHAAFEQFRKQSERIIGEEDILSTNELTLAGEFRRYDAGLALSAISMMILESDLNRSVNMSELIQALNEFPGAGRRFEKIIDGVYSDYGHHPEEVKATVEMARELVEREKYDGLAVIYEPHQNSRQHEVINGYANAFLGVDKVFWLPTYLTREDESLSVLKPEDFIGTLSNKEVAEPAEENEEFAEKLRTLRSQNYLILLMTAGPADGWLRKVFEV